MRPGGPWPPRFAVLTAASLCSLSLARGHAFGPDGACLRRGADGCVGRGGPRTAPPGSAGRHGLRRRDPRRLGRGGPLAGPRRAPVRAQSPDAPHSRLGRQDRQRRLGRRDGGLGLQLHHAGAGGRTHRRRRAHRGPDRDRFRRSHSGRPRRRHPAGLGGRAEGQGPAPGRRPRDRRRRRPRRAAAGTRLGLGGRRLRVGRPLRRAERGGKPHERDHWARPARGRAGHRGGGRRSTGAAAREPHRHDGRSGNLRLVRTAAGRDGAHPCRLRPAR